MLDQNDYKKLDKLIKRLEKEKQQAEGAHKQLLKELQRDFKCADLKAAKKKLAKFEKEAQELNVQFTKAFKVFARQNRRVLQKLASDDPGFARSIPSSLKSMLQRKTGDKET